MATIKRETTVETSGSEIWNSLIQDPNGWPTWLTPLRGLEEKAAAPVRAGSRFGARIGNLSGKIQVVEATTGQKLRWKAGPAPLLAMGMGMKGTLEFHPTGRLHPRPPDDEVAPHDGAGDEDDDRPEPQGRDDQDDRSDQRAERQLAADAPASRLAMSPATVGSRLVG